MIFLFSKHDISTAIGIPEKEAADFLRIKLFQYGIHISDKPYSAKAIVDLLWELNMNQRYKSKTNFDAMFSSWASSFQKENKQAIMVIHKSDIIEVEIL